MATNKPTLPNAFVDINNRNLGLAAIQPSGIFAFTGVATAEGTVTPDFDNIVTVKTPTEVKDKIGFGELQNHLLGFFDQGGKSALAIPVVISTEAVIGTPAYVRIASSTGTITAAPDSGKKVTDIFDVRILVTKTGATGVGKWKFSTDDGVNFGTTILMGTTTVIPGTNLEITLIGAFDKDDIIKLPITTGPIGLNADIIAAVTKYIESNNSFDAIVVTNVADAALIASLKTENDKGEQDPNFRYNYMMVRPVKSATPAAAVTEWDTIKAAISSDRIQGVPAEAVVTRSAYGDERATNVIGVVAGFRSSLALQNDIGLFNAGTLNNVLRLITGWTDSILEDIDASQGVTVRTFKGVAGIRITNGHMMDTASDIKKDAFRLVLDKASRLARIAALDFVKIDVDPADVSTSTIHLKNTIEQAIGTFLVGAGEAVAVNVNIPDGQDILTTEQLDVEIEVTPFGHASFIGITIGLVNPLLVV